jgi:hypothetical protein
MNGCHFDNVHILYVLVFVKCAQWLQLSSAQGILITFFKLLHTLLFKCFSREDGILWCNLKYESSLYVCNTDKIGKYCLHIFKN